MPPAKMRGDGRMAKDPKKTLLRLLSYLKNYLPTLLIVLCCILATAFASITGSTALGDLVDEFILPMVASGSADFAPLWQFILKLGCIFSTIGAVSADFVSRNIGLGDRIIKFLKYSNFEQSYGCIVIIALIGIIFYTIVEMIEKRVVLWKK